MPNLDYCKPCAFCFSYPYLYNSTLLYQIFYLTAFLCAFYL